MDISEAISAELPFGVPLHTAPNRGPSLGEKLGSMLRSALSLPKQPSYIPVSEEDDDAEGLGGLSENAHGGPSTRQAMPRDASYLPEWLNRTNPMLKSSSSSARSSAELSRSSDVSMAESALPEWVDFSTLQQPGPSDSAVDKLGPTQAKAQKLQHQSLPTVLTNPLKPVPAPAQSPLAPLITAPSWPPSEAPPSAAASKESRGKRLLAFWQQQQQSADAATSSTRHHGTQPTAAAEPAGQGNQTPPESQSATVAASVQGHDVTQKPAVALRAHGRVMLDGTWQGQQPAVATGMCFMTSSKQQCLADPATCVTAYLNIRLRLAYACLQM